MKKYYFDDGYIHKCENLNSKEIIEQEAIHGELQDVIISGEGMTDIEKYEVIKRIMGRVIMNPPPDCRPIKSTSRKQVYMTLYKIQRVIGDVRFLGEEEPGWSKGNKE